MIAVDDHQHTVRTNTTDQFVTPKTLVKPEVFLRLRIGHTSCMHTQRSPNEFLAGSIPMEQITLGLHHSGLFLNWESHLQYTSYNFLQIRIKKCQADSWLDGQQSDQISACPVLQATKCVPFTSSYVWPASQSLYCTSIKWGQHK